MADSSIDDNPMLKLVQSMASAVSYKENNVEMNRKVWDRYAKEWTKDTDWVVSMAENLGQEWRGGEMLEHVGDEWSDRASLEVVGPSILLVSGPFLRLKSHFSLPLCHSLPLSTNLPMSV